MPNELYAPIPTLPTPTALLSGAACFSQLTKLNHTFLLEVTSRGVCCTSFQAGLLVFNIRQSGRTVLMARGKASKLSHCKAGYALAVVIAYYSKPLKPRFGLSFPSCCSLFCSSENSMISILSTATTAFLISTVLITVKRKSKYYLLQKSSESTALVTYKRPALPLRRAAPISKERFVNGPSVLSETNLTVFSLGQTLLYTWYFMSI